jgi:superfamily II DNA or RNA helicase
VVICNAAILCSRFKHDASRWVKFVDLLLVDEVHGLSNANKITDIVSNIVTTHKYGFTGTLPEDQLTKWNIIGAIGPVLYEKSSAELRVEGYLTNASVRCLEITYKTGPAKVKEDPYLDELDFIYHNEYRNNVIKSICKGYQKNILILVNHIIHGEELARVLSGMGRKVYFIRGSTPVAERQRIIEEIESSDGVICIAISKIFSTGINVKNLHMLMFASGGKSFIRTVQAIGRGLRKHLSKQTFTIIDICDILHYGGEHGARRIAIYDKEKIVHKSIELVER